MAGHVLEGIGWGSPSRADNLVQCGTSLRKPCIVVRTTVEQITLRGEQALARLENLVAKVKLQSSDFSDIDVRIYPAQMAGTPYIIDISEGRFARRVIVDARTAMHLQPGNVDAGLSRDLRTAMLTVARRAHAHR